MALRNLADFTTLRQSYRGRPDCESVVLPVAAEEREVSTIETKQGNSTQANPDAISSPRSSLRILRLLSVLAVASEGLSLAAISQAIKAPKSSLLTILKPLVAEGFLTHNGARYLLGPEAFSLATSIAGARKFRTLMRVFMEELESKTKETIILVVLDAANRCATYADVIESSQHVRYVVPSGVTRSLHSSAGGRALLAFQPPEWLDEYLDTVDLKALTSRSPTDATTIRTKLDTVRIRCVSISEGEAVEGASGVAAPVFDQNGCIIAALLIGAPSSRAAINLERWAELVRSVADRASRSLGYRA